MAGNFGSILPALIEREDNPTVSVSKNHRLITLYTKREELVEETASADGGRARFFVEIEYAGRLDEFLRRLLATFIDGNGNATPVKEDTESQPSRAGSNNGDLRLIRSHNRLRVRRWASRGGNQDWKEADG